MSEAVPGDPLREVVAAAAAGRFPPPDGGVTVVPPDATTGLWAVLGFTAHAVVATDRPPDEVLALGADGYGGACDPAFLVGLAGPDAWFGVLDAVLVAPAGPGAGGRALGRTDRYDGHPRVRYARSVRSEVEVFGDDRGLVTIGRGLGGRLDLGLELADPAGPSPPGTGRRLLRDVLTALPEGEAVFASCSPGNARSLRALLAAGFHPVGSEVLIRPA